MRLTAIALAALAAAMAAPPAPAAVTFGVDGRTVILQVHGEGAQVYECKPDAAGHLAWTFREPIATLLKDGQTIGRHYAGPRWTLDDGSLVRATVALSTPGERPDDIPQLALRIVENKGVGALKDATEIVRQDTHGGVLKGDCPAAGTLRSAPYSADYLFLR